MLAFTKLVAKRNVFHSISISIGLDGWHNIATPEFKNKFKTPYHLCAEQCFAQASHVSKVLYDGTHVAAVYAAHEEYSNSLQAALSVYTTGIVPSNVKTIAFSRPIECVPLQSADLVSYESYRYWDKIQCPRDIKDLLSDRISMIKLDEAGFFALSGHYDGHALKTLVKRFHSINCLYDPYPGI